MHLVRDSSCLIATKMPLSVGLTVRELGVREEAMKDDTGLEKFDLESQCCPSSALWLSLLYCTSCWVDMR